MITLERSIEVEPYTSSLSTSHTYKYYMYSNRTYVAVFAHNKYSYKINHSYRIQLQNAAKATE